MFGTPKSASSEVVRMLASRSGPIPTTACGSSCTPSWRSACSSVVLATAAWVSWSAYSCTSWGAESMPRTSQPRCTSSRASELPNRPRPRTATRLSDCGFLANDGSLLGPFVPAGLFAQGESGGQRDRSQPADEHQHDQDDMAGGADVGGDAGGQADGGEGRDHLEQHDIK